MDMTGLPGQVDPRLDLLSNTRRRKRLKRNLRRGLPLYIMLAFPIFWYLLFCYVPMGGIVVAFQDFSLFKGIFGSPMAADPLKYFRQFLTDDYFWNVFRNTFLIGTANTLICFPAPILLAVMFNELRTGRFKRVSQTISYLPYFVSTVALISIITMLLNPSTGIVNLLIKSLGGIPTNFLVEPKWFIPVYVILNLWRSVGWGSIIYIATMSQINPELYEAAAIDGASRLRRIWHVTLPGIRPVIVMLMILAMPGLLGADFEAILLMQRDQTRMVSDVMSTYIYRKSFVSTPPNYSLSTAMGLFQAIVSMGIIYLSNRIAKKTADISLW